MQYTTEKEKKEIRVAFKSLLAEHDLKLSEYCRKFGLTYGIFYAELMKYSAIQHDWVNNAVHRLDQLKYLQDRNGKLVIAKKF